MQIVSTSAFDLSPLYSRGGAHRTKGLHQSDVIQFIERLLHPEVRAAWESQTPQEKTRSGVYMEMGFLWEGILEESFKRAMGEANAGVRYLRQVEVDLDGIIGSPDCVDLVEMVLEEYKATWKVSWKGQQLEKYFWRWLVQIKGYLKMLGLLRARLVVFWVNGDYRSSGPQCTQYDLQFSQIEVDANWSMLVRHADQMRAEGLA